MHKRILKKIAKKHGVTVEEVERDINIAFEAANKKSNLALTIPTVSEDGQLTIGEFINHIVHRVRNDK